MPSQTLSAKEISWVHLSEPDNEELATFVRGVDLLPVDAEFIVRDDQRPEVAVRDGYVLILIHVPVFDKQLRVTSGAPLYILVTKSSVHTVNYEPIVSLEKIFKEFQENPEKQEDYFDEAPLSLALHIISQLHVASFRKISRLAKHLEIAEDAIFHGKERHMVEEIAVLTRDVLDFRRIVRPQLSVFDTTQDLTFDEDAKAQWHRVYGQVKRMWEMLEGLMESAKEIQATNVTLLQHKENELLRLLTYYSIVTIPLWIFVAPYNPRGEGATAVDFYVFWGVLVFLLIFLLFIFARAKRRKAI